MLPENKLSSQQVAGSFFTPIRQSVFFDYELGGADFQDNSAGLNVYLWKCRYTRDGQVRVYNEIVSHDILTMRDVTEIAFAFDLNMQPTLAYVLNKIAYLRWYDSAGGNFTTTEIGNVDHPRLALDTRESTQTDIADVILAYTRNGVLYTRQQRERYTVERALGEAPGRLWHIGMMNNYRFGFVFRPEQ